MELMYPLVVEIGLPVTIVLIILFHVIKRKVSFRGGIKAANTKIARSIPEYKKIKGLSVVILYSMEIALISAVVSGLFLAARPSRVDSISEGEKKRDIFLCMDVSYSICNLNYELVDSLESVVANMEGDRFGITIFNTSPVLYVPMTDDYDFVVLKLEELKEYFALQKEYMDIYNDYHDYYDVPDDVMDRYYELSEELEYYDAGTLIDNTLKGSSLVGVGLASSLYNFPHLEDSARTRIILFSTDNAQEERMKPPVELADAVDYCIKYDVTVFGIFPNQEHFDTTGTSEFTASRAAFKRQVERTGGKYYEESSSLSVNDIVKDIEKQEALMVDEVVVKKEVDQPLIPLIVLVISLSVLFVLGMVIIL